ncbi:MAG: metalloregulator ArsR/SmtB family transcription factor [Cyanobacteria bacterium P01_F01_bin.153]
MNLENDSLDLVSNFFKVLSDPVRLKILCALGSKPQTAIALSSAIGLKPAEITQQLNIMAQVGIINRDKSGGSIHYTITDSNVLFLCDMVSDLLVNS